MEIEHRLDRIESRIAILDLTARYCHGADGRDVSAFRSVWHPEATWDVSTRQFHGLEQIVEAVAQQWESFASMHHSTSNPIIEFTSDDDATGRHDVLTLTVLRNGQALLSTGQYVDRYARSDGRWAITERHGSVAETVQLSAPLINDVSRSTGVLGLD